MVEKEKLYNFQEKFSNKQYMEFLIMPDEFNNILKLAGQLTTTF